MSSSETIDELRQKHDRTQKDLKGPQNELVILKQSIASLEAQVLGIEVGDEGLLNSLALFMKATNDMEKLKNQSGELTKGVGVLLSDSSDFQNSLHSYFDRKIKTLNGIDKMGPGKDNKTFEQKLEEALAKLKE